MSTTVLERASAGDELAFRELTEPFRRELEFHCYRMLGSVQDAEDALQETMLAAWRALNSFERRASLRTWLYRIATNRCLNVLRDAGRRPQSVPPLTFEIPAPTRMSDSRWLEPYADDRLGWLADSQPGPAARYEGREAIELAFIGALQRLRVFLRCSSAGAAAWAVVSSSHASRSTSASATRATRWRCGGPAVFGYPQAGREPAGDGR